jgi:hypothetical protein
VQNDRDHKTLHSLQVAMMTVVMGFPLHRAFATTRYGCGRAKRRRCRGGG